MPINNQNAQNVSKIKEHSVLMYGNYTQKEYLKF